VIKTFTGLTMAAAVAFTVGGALARKLAAVHSPSWERARPAGSLADAAEEETLEPIPDKKGVMCSPAAPLLTIIPPSRPPRRSVGDALNSPRDHRAIGPRVRNEARLPGQVASNPTSAPAPPPYKTWRVMATSPPEHAGLLWNIAEPRRLSSRARHIVPAD